MAKVVKKPVAPIYAVAIVWVLWGLLFPLYKVIHFVLVIALSLIVFGVAKLIWPNKTYNTAEQKKGEPESSSDPAIAELIAERDRAVSEMRRLNDSIEDATVSDQIDRLEATTRKIIAHVADNPEKLPQIRRFMNYYLPTTLKLLNAYDRMVEVDASGENIDGTKAKVEDMMETIVKAFDKQLDALFGNEALDISTDITVMEQMLAREGIGGMQINSDS